MELLGAIVTVSTLVVVLGLSFHPLRLGRPRIPIPDDEKRMVASGESDGVRFTAVAQQGIDWATEGLATRLSVTCTGRATPLLTIRSASALSKDDDPDIVIGDPAFDGEVDVRGPRVLAAALLDAALRERVRRAVAAGWRLVDGTWSASLIVPDDSASAAAVAEGVALSVAFDPEGRDIPDALGERVRTDPVVGVRVRALTALCRA